MLLSWTDVWGGVPRGQKRSLPAEAKAPETAGEEQWSRGFSKELNCQWHSISFKWECFGKVLDFLEMLRFCPLNSFIKISTWKLIFHKASMQNWTVSASGLAYERSIQKGVTFQWKSISFSLFWVFFSIYSAHCILFLSVPFISSVALGNSPTTFGSCTRYLSCYEDEVLVEKSVRTLPSFNELIFKKKAKLTDL